MSISRSKVLERIYNKIEDLLANLFKIFNNIDIQVKLNNKNKKIATRNKVDNIKTNKLDKIFIDIKIIFEFFVRQNVLYKKLARDFKDRVIYKNLLNKLAKENYILLDNNDYSIK